MCAILCFFNSYKENEFNANHPISQFLYKFNSMVQLRRSWRNLSRYKPKTLQKTYLDKACVLDHVKLISDSLSLHFYNQSEINSEDNPK